jgi:hypothetical protein
MRGWTWADAGRLAAQGVKGAAASGSGGFGVAPVDLRPGVRAGEPYR